MICLGVMHLTCLDCNALNLPLHSLIKIISVASPCNRLQVRRPYVTVTHSVYLRRKSQFVYSQLNSWNLKQRWCLICWKHQTLSSVGLSCVVVHWDTSWAIARVMKAVRISFGTSRIVSFPLLPQIISSGACECPDLHPLPVPLSMLLYCWISEIAVHVPVSGHNIVVFLLDLVASIMFWCTRQEWYGP
jgi:hypothetical protein